MCLRLSVSWGRMSAIQVHEQGAGVSVLVHHCSILLYSLILSQVSTLEVRTKYSLRRAHILLGSSLFEEVKTIARSTRTNVKCAMTVWG